MAHELQIVGHRDCKPHVKDKRQLVSDESTDNVKDIGKQGSKKDKKEHCLFLIEGFSDG